MSQFESDMPEIDIPDPSLNGLFPTFKLWWEAYRINRGLKKSDEGERSVALKQLSSIGPLGAKIVPIMLRLDRMGARALRIFCLFFFFLGVQGLWKYYHLGVSISPDSFLHSWMRVVGLPVIILSTFRPITERHRRMVETLAKCDDPRVVRAILDIAAIDRFGSSGLDIAINALKRLQPDQMNQIDDSVLIKVRKAINSRNPALSEAAIATVSRIGDTGALQNVRAVAEGRRSGRKFESVRREAQACADKLEGLAQTERNAAVLLRPASGLPLQDVVLLRPAAASQSDSELLLRPTDHE